MIRASELGGRAVVDIDAAEKLGSIDTLIIDPEARRVVGFVLSRGAQLFAPAAHAAIAASAIHAIGPDAVTVRHDRIADAAPLVELPRVSDLIGRKVVSENGRLLGVVEDVLISGPDGRVVGYELARPNALAKLERMFRERPARQGAYLRADAAVRTGRDLIVAPEDALGSWDGEETSAPPATPVGAARFRP